MSVAPHLTTPQPPPAKSTAEMFVDMCKPLFPPALTDMRRRCAEALKAAGAPERYIAIVLAVEIEAPK